MVYKQMVEDHTENYRLEGDCRRSRLYLSLKISPGWGRGLEGTRPSGVVLSFQASALDYTMSFKSCDISKPNSETQEAEDQYRSPDMVPRPTP